MKYILLIISILVINTSIAQHNILPKPTKIEVRQGLFVIDKSPFLTVSENNAAVQKIAEELANKIAKHSGKNTKVLVGNFKSKVGINFLTAKDSKFGQEGYTLDVSPKNITIIAQTSQGFLCGVEALMQLMPHEIYTDMPTKILKITVPCYYIEYLKK
jgi:hexosaminidase